MSVAQKISRNIDVIHRVLKSRFVSSNPIPYVFHEELRPTLPRHELTYRIFDEEKAEVDYRQLAEHPAIKQNELSHSTVLGIAEDEKRHAQQLRDILDLLKREGKIV